MKVEQERVKNLLTDTVTLLCKNGLQFHKELKVQGLLGITLDDSDVFIVHINEAFGGEVVAVRTEEDADSSALGLSHVTHGEREPSSSGAEKHKHRSHFNTNKKRRNSAESPNDATPVRHKQHKQEPGIGQGSEDEPIHVKTEPDDFMLLDSCDRQAELNLRLAPDIIIPGSTSSGSQVNDQSNSSYSDQCPSVGNHGGRGQYISGIVRHSQSDPSTPGTSAMDMGGGHSAYGGTPGEQALQDTSWGTQPESQGSQSTQNTSEDHPPGSPTSAKIFKTDTLADCMHSRDGQKGEGRSGSVSAASFAVDSFLAPIRALTSRTSIQNTSDEPDESENFGRMRSNNEILDDEELGQDPHVDRMQIRVRYPMMPSLKGSMDQAGTSDAIHMCGYQGCNKAFRHRHNMLRHQRDQHGRPKEKFFDTRYRPKSSPEKPHLCDFPGCDKNFYNADNLRRHQKTSHLEWYHSKKGFPHLPWFGAALDPMRPPTLAPPPSSGYLPTPLDFSAEHLLYRAGMSLQDAAALAGGSSSFNPSALPPPYMPGNSDDTDTIHHKPESLRTDDSDNSLPENEPADDDINGDNDHHDHDRNDEKASM